MKKLILILMLFSGYFAQAQSWVPMGTGTDQRKIISVGDTLWRTVFGTNGTLYVRSAAWNTANFQAKLNGTGFVKISGTTISYDNSTYLTPTGDGSNLTGIVKLATSQTITGIKTVDRSNGFVTDLYGNTIQVSNNARTIYTVMNNEGINYGSNGFEISVKSLTATANRAIQFPDASGTVALTTDIPSGIVLTTTNQTIEGEKTFSNIMYGLSASFLSSATGFAIQGTTTAVSSGGGVAGYANTTGGVGVYGQSNVSNGYGGWFTTTAGTGVMGQATSSGYGGFFMSSSGEGIYAQSLTGIIARFQSSASLLQVLTVNQTNATFGAPIIGTSATFSETGLFLANIGATTSSKYLDITNTGGNLTIGVNNSAGNTLLSGGVYSSDIYTSGATRLRLGTNSTTAVSIESNQVVTFSTSVSNSNSVFFNANHPSTPFGPAISFTAATPNNAIQYFLAGIDSTNPRFYLMSNGGLHNYSANNVNLSDRDSKKNITKAGSYWNIIKAIEFDNFNYKEQSDNRKLLGVMAQQVETVFPLWVAQNSGFKDENGKEYKGVYQDQIQFGVNIVVQESQKRIEKLEDDLAALKAKIK